MTFPKIKTPPSFNLSTTEILKFFDSDLLTNYIFYKDYNKQGPEYHFQTYLLSYLEIFIDFNPDIGKNVTSF